VASRRVAGQLPAFAATHRLAPVAARLVAAAEHEALAGLGTGALARATTHAATTAAAAATTGTATIAATGAAATIIATAMARLGSWAEVDDVAELANLARLRRRLLAGKDPDQANVGGAITSDGQRFHQAAQAVAAHLQLGADLLGERAVGGSGGCRSGTGGSLGSSLGSLGGGLGGLGGSFGADASVGFSVGGARWRRLGGSCSRGFARLARGRRRWLAARLRLGD
jgi:hypothetical protein